MYPSMILIGSDTPGGGKDTMALRLADYGYKRYSFGNPLKTEVTAALTDPDYRDQIWDLMPEACQQAMQVCLALGQLDAFAKPTTPEMRTLLQQYGTEFRRMCTKATYWLDALDQAIEVDKPSKIVIPDQRFSNEFYWGKHRGAESWYVKRAADAYAYTAEAVKHPSEGQLENLSHDWRVSNDGSIQELWEKIDIQMLSFREVRALCSGVSTPVAAWTVGLVPKHKAGKYNSTYSFVLEERIEVPYKILGYPDWLARAIPASLKSIQVPIRPGREHQDLMPYLGVLWRMPVLGLDLETSGPKERDGLDPISKSSNVILGQFGNQKIVFVVQPELIPFFKEPLESETILKLNQNIEFDFKFLLSKYGIQVVRMYCTMLAEQVLRAGRDGFGVSLLDLLRYHACKLISKAVRSEFSNHSGVFTEEQLYYAARDVFLLFPIFNSQNEEIKELGLGVVAKDEFRIIPAVAEMELTGVWMDPVKKTELQIRIMQMTTNPKPLIAVYGQSELWFNKWLKEIEEDWVHETLDKSSVPSQRSWLAVDETASSLCARGDIDTLVGSAALISAGDAPSTVKLQARSVVTVTLTMRGAVALAGAGVAFLGAGIGVAACLAGVCATTALTTSVRHTKVRESQFIIASASYIGQLASL